MAAHLFAYAPGWTQTTEYPPDDHRLPEGILAFAKRNGCGSTIATPLAIGGRTLGWLTLTNAAAEERPEDQWWRIELFEAIAPQAALALHHGRVVDRSRVEARRKTIL